MRTGDIIISLHRAAQAADAYWNHPDMTQRQYVLLRAIADLEAKNERINQIKLTDVTGMDRSTLAEVIRRLEVRKWVKRKRDKEDRRSMVVALTADGRGHLHRAVQEAADVERFVLSCVHAKNAAAFIDAIHALANSHVVHR